MDNIFIERLWRSIKYEEVHLNAYADGCEARSGINSWMNFYNFRRPHQAMNNQMPMAVWRAGDPPPLNWSTLKYVFGRRRGPQC